MKRYFLEPKYKDKSKLHKHHDAVDHYGYSNHSTEPKKLVITLKDDVSEFSEQAQNLEQKLKEGNWIYRETKHQFGDTRLIYTPRRKDEKIGGKTPTLNIN